jgi:hypothetical protein
VHVDPITAEITKLLVCHVLVVHVHVAVESIRGYSAAVVVDREAISLVCDGVVEVVHLGGVGWGSHFGVELNFGVKKSLGWGVDRRGGIHGRIAGSEI